LENEKIDPFPVVDRTPKTSSHRCLTSKKQKTSGSTNAVGIVGSLIRPCKHGFGKFASAAHWILSPMRSPFLSDHRHSSTDPSIICRSAALVGQSVGIRMVERSYRSMN